MEKHAAKPVRPPPRVGRRRHVPMHARTLSATVLLCVLLLQVPNKVVRRQQHRSLPSGFDQIPKRHVARVIAAYMAPWVVVRPSVRPGRRRRE